MIPQIAEGIAWRWRLRVIPHLVAWGSPKAALARSMNNWREARRKLVYGYIYANPTNSGDYISWLGIRDILQVPGYNLRCSPAALRSTFALLAAAKESRQELGGLIVGGGGLLQPCFEDMWRNLLALRVPFVLIGIGVNHLAGMREFLVPALAAEVARRATAIHVRDYYTRDYLKELSGRIDITCGLCPSVYRLYPLRKRISMSGTHLLHVVHESDLEFAGGSPCKIRARVRELAGNLGLIYDETSNMSGASRRLLRRYARSALVISSRLHGCIFSYALGKPFVAINCDDKIKWFLDSHVPTARSVSARDASRHLNCDFARETMDIRVDGSIEVQLAHTYRMIKMSASRLLNN